MYSRSSHAHGPPNAARDVEGIAARACGASQEHRGTCLLDRYPSLTHDHHRFRSEGGIFQRRSVWTSLFSSFRSSRARLTPLGGYPHLGYLIRFGDYTICHSGDCGCMTVSSTGCVPINVTVALLPIDGNGNFEIANAAQLAEDIHARAVRSIGSGAESEALPADALKSGVRAGGVASC